MHSFFCSFITVISLALMKPFSKNDSLYARKSFIPSELENSKSNFSYKYRLNNGKLVSVYVWYEGHQFHPSNNFLMTGKRYKWNYTKRSFDEQGKMISEESGIFYS